METVFDDFMRERSYYTIGFKNNKSLWMGYWVKKNEKYMFVIRHIQKSNCFSVLSAWQYVSRSRHTIDGSGEFGEDYYIFFNNRATTQKFIRIIVFVKSKICYNFLYLNHSEKIIVGCCHQITNFGNIIKWSQYCRRAEIT